MAEKTKCRYCGKEGNIICAECLAALLAKKKKMSQEINNEIEFEKRKFFRD